ncbi:MAG: hypothetical protein D6732_20500 [Methanobacteriota archaeon]|nr:MAG: hypothetical protein D6732_20500 [Euryarchaeota archaeon]
MLNSDNIFRALGIQTKEDCISNAIAYTFNSSQDFKKYFLDRICNKDISQYRECTAYTRVSTGSTGIPDITLVCRGDDSADIIIIENKLKAIEGENQAQKYSMKESIDALHQIFCPELNRNSVKASFVFLSLFPDINPSSDRFLVKRHAELCEFKNEITNNYLSDRLISDWIELVEAFYEKATLSDDDILSHKLQDDEGLDGGYLYFRTFLSNIKLSNGLTLEDFFRASRQGRHFYGAIFSKDSWHPAEMAVKDKGWSLDPDRVFNIHFEPQYNVLSGVFSIYLHYETNPYEPAKWVEENIPAEQYRAYIGRRNRFIEMLMKYLHKPWSFYNGTNMVAKAELDFSGYTMKDAINTIEKLFHEATIAIDRVLEKLSGDIQR